MGNYIMLQGTSSDVGKSIVTAAICRILKQDGYFPAPFKAQNMALNSYVTSNGDEMGRAQVVQAEAAGIQPRVEMNPILLKPTGNASSQVIVMGRPVGTMQANEYHQKFARQAFSVVEEALEKLLAQHDVLVIEGAGSPAEVNLKANDIVNMRVAKHLQAPVLLIADIDRGGALASLVGTLALLDDDERCLVKGLIVNKFRGDISLLQPALDFLQERTGLPVLGVLPYIDKLDIDDEDSVALTRKNSDEQRDIQIAVIQLPRISNFTDFAALAAEDDVSVNYVKTVKDLVNPDMIILPGSKNTIEDLLFLKQSGLSAAIISCNKRGVPIIGICGGYQMLGEKVLDPEHTESALAELAGLGLLPVVTTFAAEKITRQVEASTKENIFLGLMFSFEKLLGYEIHMGRTEYTEPVRAAFMIDRGDGQLLSDGCVRSDGLVMGSYIHGIFDNDGLRRAIIDGLRVNKGLAINEGGALNMAEKKEAAYERLAQIVRSNLDMAKVYEIMGLQKS